MDITIFSKYRIDIVSKLKSWHRIITRVHTPKAKRLKHCSLGLQRPCNTEGTRGVWWI